jgi:dTDP-4-dehydrorhamnose reductase
VSRYLVTGAGGQLGADLLRVLAGSPHEVVGLTRAELDVTSAAAVEKAVVDARPDVVLNAAAYTAVDAAETDEVTALAVNAEGPANLARVCALHGGRVVHVSTDYVFAGDATTPYEVGAPTGPRSAYGRTKLAGERAVLAALPSASVVRTAWVYGGPGANFVDTMVRLEATRDTVDVVADQIGSPTWVQDLAGALIELGSAAVAPGIVHYANAGSASWHQLAVAVFEELGADPARVRPVPSTAFARPAPRPPWSVLSTRSWTERGLAAPRPWRDAVRACLADRPAAR